MDCPHTGGIILPQLLEAAMSSASAGFTVHETHGILLQPGFEISVSSDERG